MQKETVKCYKVIETEWEPTDGLRAIEEVEYEERLIRNERTTTERTRLWGFVDENGEISIEIKYHCVWKFRDGLSKVRLGNQWGVIDISGAEVIPVRYQALFSLPDGMIQVQLNGKWGYLNRRGETVINCRYDYIFPFRNGFAGVKQDGKYGFINIGGEEVTGIEFDEIWLLASDKSVRVRVGVQWKVIYLP